jgi:hypothetical protein
MHSREERQKLAGWVRFLLPSAADLIFLALVLLLSLSGLSSRVLGDGDIGWHIRNGEQMLATHAIPRVDVFSSTMHNQPWYAWEWLYDLAIAGIHGWMGLNGVVVFTAAVIALSLTLTFRMALHRGATLPVDLAMVMLTIGASAIHWLARPHVLSWLLTVVWFCLLDSWEKSIGGARDRSLLWLPVLMVFWVNIHGGFLMGFALLGIYLACEVLHCFVWERKPGAGKRLKWLGGVTGLSLAASLVNPYGYKLHEHVYEYLSNHWLMNHIDEFKSPNFHGVAEQCFLGLLVIVVVTIAFAPERPRLAEAGVILFAVCSGLYASRSLPASAILLMLVGAPMLSEAMAAADKSALLAPGLRRWLVRFDSYGARTRETELRLRGHVWPALAFVLVLSIAASGGEVGSHQVMDAHFDSQKFPVQAVDLIAAIHVNQPIFCPDNWGGYLIYRLYPQTRVVVDDRHDLYGSDFFKQYLKIIRADPSWNDLLQAKGVRVVLAPAQSGLATALDESSDWRPTYQDEVAVVFERSQTNRYGIQ